MKKNHEDFNDNVIDVLIIGGGPAGMMAAGTAGKSLKEKSKKYRVVIIEKNDTLGKKLRITGGGRCNITNYILDNRQLLEKYKKAEPFLYSAFSKFSVQETLSFFKEKGLEVKIENEGRVFPVSDNADDVWKVMIDYCKENGVEIMSSQNVNGFSVDKNNILGVTLSNGQILRAKNYILCTGGKSHPETGSTGDGFVWLQHIGHKINDINSSLVPITTNQKWVHSLAGNTINNIKLSLLTENRNISIQTEAEAEKNIYSEKFQNGNKGRGENKDSEDVNKFNVKQNLKKVKLKIKKDVNGKIILGKVLFTHFGLSGPSVLNLSSTIKDLLNENLVYISIDLLPEMEIEHLEKYLIDNLYQNNKIIKNSLLDILNNTDFNPNHNLTQNLVEIILNLSDIDENIASNSITVEMRKKLCNTIKALNIKVSGLLGNEKAIVSSGGLDLTEVDTRYMQSRLYNNLYFAGDILDIDRPSGGYSLQLCWTTGYVAGKSAVEGLVGVS